MVENTTAELHTNMRSRLTGKYGALEEYVWDKVGKLQGKYIAGSSSAVASLARLRRAVSAEPGSDPFVWQETLEGLPKQFVGDDQTVSLEERAVHAAMTLFAVHQQSKIDKMHKPRISFGAAASKLAYATGMEGKQNPAVLRRFQALGTATSLTESVTNARGLIGQFRSAGISLDYGRLAVDLARLQDSRSADTVRLEWGRAYYFKPDARGSEEPEPVNSTTTTSPNGDTE